MHKRLCYVLTQEDMRKIYTIATSSRDKFIAYLLYETGMRLTECAALYCKDFVKGSMSQASYIQLKDRGTLSTGGYLKTGERKIYIPHLLYKVYGEYMRDRESYLTEHSFLLINLKGKRAGEPMSLLSLQKLISRWQRHTGLPLTSSIFRYSHGRTHYEATKSIQCVHERLGHSNIQISINRYTCEKEHEGANQDVFE